ncbi:MAG: hypothetical protein IJH67_14440 [Thermoguttaceae bacterium]|nr:hypothetical protein [Thermoguttaceae bacterium]
MNTNSQDVVKSVESTSNEQRQTVKPIVISRRRLLRAGVAGIPVVLTMAGVAPGQSIMGQASAASGLVYGGTGVGVRERFDNTNKVQDNLVWSNNNGFVIDKTHNKLFTEEISTTDRTVNGTATITISGTATSGTVEKTVNVTAKDNFPVLTFDAFLHKSGVYYTDFLLTKVGGANATTPSIQAYFEGLTVTDYFDFTIAGESTPLDTSKVTSAQLADVSVTFDNSWTKTTGYQHGSDSATTYYYLVPGTESTAITVKFKIKATIEDVTRDVTVGENTTEPCTFESNGSATTDEISFVFKVQGKTYTQGT